MADALSPLLGLAFALGALLFVGGIVSRTLGLARGSHGGMNLEETAVNLGLRVAVGAGLIWLLLWAWENVIPDFVENLPGG